MLTNQKRKLESLTDGQRNRKQARNRKKGKKAAPVARVKRGEPVYLYLCDCHNERAKKNPCERSAADRAERKYSESTLGKWHCSVTGRKTKVKRVRNVKETETTNV